MVQAIVATAGTCAANTKRTAIMNNHPFLTNVSDNINRGLVKEFGPLGSDELSRKTINLRSDKFKGSEDDNFRAVKTITMGQAYKFENINTDGITSGPKVYGYRLQIEMESKNEILSSSACYSLYDKYGYDVWLTIIALGKPGSVKTEISDDVVIRLDMIDYTKYVDESLVTTSDNWKEYTLLFFDKNNVVQAPLFYVTFGTHVDHNGDFAKITDKIPE